MCVVVHIYSFFLGVWLSVMLEALLYSYTFCSLIFLIVLCFFCFSFKCSVFKLCCMHLSFLFNFFTLKMCICSIYKVLAFSFGSVFVVLILQSIASVVLIYKSLWIK